MNREQVYHRRFWRPSGRRAPGGPWSGRWIPPADIPAAPRRSDQASLDRAACAWVLPPGTVVVVVVDAAGVAFTIAFASPRSVPALVTSCLIRAEVSVGERGLGRLVGGDGLRDVRARLRRRPRSSSPIPCSAVPCSPARCRRSRRGRRRASAPSRPPSRRRRRRRRAAGTGSATTTRRAGARR